MATHSRFTIDADIAPQFTACYLRLAGDECAFIEAHTAHALPRLLEALEQHDGGLAGNAGPEDEVGKGGTGPQGPLYAFPAASEPLH
ncbi:hypothetical protein ACMHYB_22845 [Sorangium sp. So ce1128]